jgi:hypothetical protein
MLQPPAERDGHRFGEPNYDVAKAGLSLDDETITVGLYYGAAGSSLALAAWGGLRQT